jgi:SH3-like domain-containing protein
VRLLIAVLTLLSNLDLKGTSQDVRYTKPYHASLKSAVSFIRVGPSKDHPVAWVVLCQRFPLTISAHFDLWRKVHGPRGVSGWVHRSLLSFKQTVFIPKTCCVRVEPSCKSAIIAIVQAPNVLEVIEKKGVWLFVKVGTLKGYIQITPFNKKLTGLAK